MQMIYEAIAIGLVIGIPFFLFFVGFGLMMYIADNGLL